MIAFPHIAFIGDMSPSGCTVASCVVGVVVVVGGGGGGVCNRCQMRISKRTCLIFGVIIGFDPGYKCTKGISDRSKFKVTRNISPTISGWLLVVTSENFAHSDIAEFSNKIKQVLKVI